MIFNIAIVLASPNYKPYYYQIFWRSDLPAILHKIPWKSMMGKIIIPLTVFTAISLTYPFLFILPGNYATLGGITILFSPSLTSALCISLLLLSTRRLINAISNQRSLFILVSVIVVVSICQFLVIPEYSFENI